MAHAINETLSGQFGDAPFVDVLGDTAVASPPAKYAPVAIGIMLVLALVGFYVGLNGGDHRTRLPGDARNNGELSSVDFSRAKVAVALKPEEAAPPPPPPAPKAAAVAVIESGAPVAKAPPPAPIIEAAPPAPAAPPPPPNLDGLF